MLIEDQLITMTWHKKIRDYYINKGYNYTRDKDTFIVKVTDLHPTSKKNVRIICDCCGEEIIMTYDCYLNSISTDNKIYCKNCIKNKNKTEKFKKLQDEYYQKVIDFCNENNYILVTKKEDVVNTQSQITYICPIHGEYTTKLTSILQNAKCYKCSRQIALQKKYSKDLEERQNKLFEKVLYKCKEKGYELISKKSDILNNSSYIEYLCQKHGLHKMRVNNLITGKGCPECGRERISILNKFDKAKVISKVEECGGVILNPDEYVNNSTKNLRILCPQCKNPFITSLVIFTQHGGQVCENCRDSETIGEKRIRSYLEFKNIPFEQEKWFDECRDIKPLPFDFYLPSKNTIIEFDGRQHFKDTNYFSYSLEKTKEHDEIKNKYCYKNNINLIRIPYYKINNINTILDTYFNSHEDIV